MSEQDKTEQGVVEAASGLGILGGTAASLATATAAGAGAAVAAGAAGGVLIGMGIEHVTDGAVSDAISDGLIDLVGEEESYQAAQAFDDGEYLEGIGHMASGAGSTIAEAAGDAYDAVSEVASDAYDAVSDTASGAYDTVSDVASGAYDTVSDAASDAWDSVTSVFE
jgi:hypothetical protein